MEVILIAALSRNHVIGRRGQLPWRLSEDLKRFRRLTRGFPVLMGRKTYDSIGKPLPERDNVVVTRNSDWSAAGVMRASSVDEALASLKANGAQCVFVIGGGEVYTLALPWATRLELTEVEAEVEGDAFFPTFDPTRWRVIESVPGQEGGLKYAFVTYVRA